jgi:hypothetical protein
MLKKIVFAVLILLFVVAGYLTYSIFINPKSPKGKAEFDKNGNSLEVIYYRPYKKERLIFGEKADGALVPYGEYWRLGANFATTFETQGDIAVGGRMLQAGRYRVYAIPYADHWLVAFNSEAGTFGYNPPDYANDIMRLNIQTEQRPTVTEQFTIDFVNDSAGLALQMVWDTTSILIPIQ